MLTHTKAFSLTMAALLALTLTPGAPFGYAQGRPFGHASLGYARNRQGRPSTAGNRLFLYRNGIVTQ
ncbi:MAG: hypothetical protein ISS49_10485 [Anaerolineae bacterium]|nr:hypothetical protein [Anaerolineae bacterium]